MSTSSGKSRYGLQSARASTSGTGAVDESTFNDSFEQVPNVIVTSSRDIVEQMEKIKSMLSLNPEEWEKRVDHLKRLRSLLVNGAQQYEEFFIMLKELDIPMQSCVTDLRSLVVREACITVAFLSVKLTTKVDRFLESMLDPLIALISNSVKVISTSGIIGLKFVIKHTQSPRFIPIFAKELSSKSNVIRRYMCEMLAIMCQEWPTNILERQLNHLQESIKKGVNDADQEARALSRLTFTYFYGHFPDQGNEILNSLDANKRRLLEKDITIVTNTTATASRATTASSRSAKPSTNNTLAAAARTVPSSDSSRSRIMTSSTHARGDEKRSRNLVRKAGTQSTPASREVSPSSKSGVSSTASTTQPSYRITSGSATTRAAVVSSTTQHHQRLPSGVSSRVSSGMTRSKPIPRSQGASRETSPLRCAPSGGGENYPAPWNAMLGGTSTGVATGGMNHTAGGVAGVGGIASLPRYQRRNSQGAGSNRGHDPNAALADSLRQGRRHASRDTMDSDDVSEISSTTSEGGFASEPSRFTDNVTEIMKMLQHSQWRERRDGMLNFQIYLKEGKPLKYGDIQRISEILNRSFNEVKGGVFLVLLETIQIFVKEYHEYLATSLYMLLMRLLSKQGSNVLQSHADMLADTLHVVRNSFPLDVQFRCACRYLTDATQTPNLKTKNYLLIYMHNLVSMCSSSENIYGEAMHNEIINALAKIINYTTEPKSPEVRKNAEEVVWLLFDLDPPRWDRAVATLGKGFQENAMRVIHRRMPVGDLPLPSQQQHISLSSPPPLLLPPSSSSSLINNNNNNGINSNDSSSGHLHQFVKPQEIRRPSVPPPGTSQSSGIPRSGIPQRSLTSPTPQSIPNQGGGGGGSIINNSPHNNKISPEDITVFIRQTTENIQSLSNKCNQVGDRNSPGVMVGGPGGGGGGGGGGRLGGSPYHNGSATATAAGGGGGGVNSSSTAYQHYDPQQYKQAPTSPSHVAIKSNIPPVYGSPALSYDSTSDEMPPDDLMGEILQELSNHNERHEERKTCMAKLGRLIREGGVDDWNEHFKPTLFLLLEILGDTEVELRAQALRVLQDLLAAEPTRFEEYTHLTIMKILEAHRDDEKTVVTAAEGCAKTLASTLPATVLHSVLHPVILDSEVKIKIAAIKMLQHLFASISESTTVREIFHNVAPALVQGCNDENSQIRKCCVFSLVEVYCRLGKETLDHLQSLGLEGNRMRLLQLFIDRKVENENRTTT